MSDWIAWPRMYLVSEADMILQYIFSVKEGPNNEIETDL